MADLTSCLERSAGHSFAPEPKLTFGVDRSVLVAQWSNARHRSKLETLTAAIGTKRTRTTIDGTSALRVKADLCGV
jgi:hypothetical protein